MNRAPVAKKVLQYLAHAEGICLSGRVLIQDIKAFVSAPRSDLLMGAQKKHGDVSHGESGDNCRTCDLAIGGIANCELFGERDKRRLTRFVLAFWNLVNSSPKTLRHKMPIGM